MKYPLDYSVAVINYDPRDVYNTNHTELDGTRWREASEFDCITELTVTYTGDVEGGVTGWSVVEEQFPFGVGGCDTLTPRLWPWLPNPDGKAPIRIVSESPTELVVQFCPGLDNPPPGWRDDGEEFWTHPLGQDITDPQAIRALGLNQCGGAWVRVTAVTAEGSILPLITNVSCLKLYASLQGDNPFQSGFITSNPTTGNSYFNYSFDSNVGTVNCPLWVAEVDSVLDAGPFEANGTPSDAGKLVTLVVHACYSTTQQLPDANIALGDTCCDLPDTRDYSIPDENNPGPGSMLLPARGRPPRDGSKANPQTLSRSNHGVGQYFISVFIGECSRALLGEEPDEWDFTQDGTDTLEMYSDCTVRIDSNTVPKFEAIDGSLWPKTYIEVGIDLTTQVGHSENRLEAFPGSGHFVVTGTSCGVCCGCKRRPPGTPSSGYPLEAAYRFSHFEDKVCTFNTGPQLTCELFPWGVQNLGGTVTTTYELAVYVRDEAADRSAAHHIGDTPENARDACGDIITISPTYLENGNFTNVWRYRQPLKDYRNLSDLDGNYLQTVPMYGCHQMFSTDCEVSSGSEVVIDKNPAGAPTYPGGYPVVNEDGSDRVDDHLNYCDVSVFNAHKREYVTETSSYEIVPSDYPIPTPEAGWTPTEGSKSCPCSPGLVLSNHIDEKYVCDTSGFVEITWEELPDTYIPLYGGTFGQYLKSSGIQAYGQGHTTSVSVCVEDIRFGIPPVAKIHTGKVTTSAAHATHPDYSSSIFNAPRGQEFEDGSRQEYRYYPALTTCHACSLELMSVPNVAFHNTRCL